MNATCTRPLAAACLLAAAAAAGAANVLHIGTSGSLAPGRRDKEAAARESLVDLIKTETGLTGDIARQDDWRQLADKVAAGRLQLGVFQGYEFAWARPDHPTLKPLALAVNAHRYPTVHVVAARDAGAAGVAGLKGKAVAVPAGPGYLRLVIDRMAAAAGGPSADGFFSKVTTPDNAEDAIDDAIDGAVGAAVVDRAALEAFKRRKPGRFKRLAEVAKSPPLPPTLIAFAEGGLDRATADRFRDGLVNASRKDRGQTLLTLFRLTGFETVPGDLDAVLAECRRAYPPPPAGGGK